MIGQTIFLRLLQKKNIQTRSYGCATIFDRSVKESALDQSSGALRMFLSNIKSKHKKLVQLCDVSRYTKQTQLRERDKRYINEMFNRKT